MKLERLVGWLDNTANLNTTRDRSGRMLNSTPMYKSSDEDEFIWIILFSASEKASNFINGIVILVDGEFSAYSGV